MVAASSRSVLAKRPEDWAKALTRRGLTTAKGRPAAAKVLATIVSKPPVASMTTSFGLRMRRRSTKPSRPVASRGTQKEYWEGRTWMSSWSFEMSMPTMLLFSIVTHPCACGLASWPKRLSGFSGTDAGGDTCSPMVLLDRGRLRLPPAADPRTLSPQAGFKIQGRRASCATAQRRAGWGDRSTHRANSRELKSRPDRSPHPVFFARARSEVRPPHEGEVRFGPCISFISYAIALGFRGYSPALFATRHAMDLLLPRWRKTLRCGTMQPNS